MSEPTIPSRPSIAMLAVGAVLFVVLVAAWLFAELNHVGTGPLFTLAGPIIAGLFLVGPISETRNAAQAAAAQTNGVMDGRVKAAVTAALAERDGAVEAAVAAALAKRDAARTRQALGDIGLGDHLDQQPDPAGSQGGAQ